MSRLKILTSFNIELDFEIPDFHKRLFAWVFDVIIVFIYIFAISKIISIVSNGRVSAEDGRWMFLIILLPIALYPLVTEITMRGQTIGKKIMGIRVINEGGGNATISQFVIRWLLRVSDLFLLIIILVVTYNASHGQSVDIGTLLFFLLIITDILCVIITKKSQRIGDIAAGTILINLRSKAGLDETVFMEMDDNYVPVFPQVMKLTDRDLNIIKSVYNTVVKKNDYALAERTAEKIETALKIRNTQHPLTFLETLLKDYNYLSTK